MQANQSQLIKLWPLRPHQTTRMNLQKTKKSGKIETEWWNSKNLETYLRVLLSNYLVPSYCTFSRLRNLLSNLFPSTNLLPFYTYFKSLSSMPPFRWSSHAPPVLFLFSLYSYQPLKLNMFKRIHFPFFYFPSFFKNQNAPSPLMQNILLPYVCSHINSFFLIKYFSYLFERTCLSESWIAAHILLSNNRKTKIERIKTKRVSNLATYQILK